MQRSLADAIERQRAHTQLRIGLGIVAIFASIVSATVLGAQSGRGAATPQKEVLPGPGTTWSLAAVGDALIKRPIAPFENDGDPRFARMTQILRAADAAFLNLEISLFRLSEFKGWPEVENGGNWELGPPEAAHDLKAMGFDLFNRANNHTTDYGVEGMRLTNQLLDEAGIVHAGSGMTLGQASRPGYLDTPKGRVALIGLATTFTPMSRAGEARDDVMGRPGLNALRVDRKYTADPDTLQTLRGAAARLGVRVPEDPRTAFRLFGMLIEPGASNRLVETVNPRDEARILREVRNAANMADYVVVNSHSHEPGNDSVVPPEWLREFVKKCLDAGGTTFVIHGPHQLRGIEVYKGKPIFYSLGNFVFQNETIDPMPSDHYEQFNLPNTALSADLYDARFKGGTSGFPSNSVWYESVAAVTTFRGTQVSEIKLYPIELGHKAPRSQRGTPRMADEATGRTIIERLTRLSAEFGTPIRLENGVGVWRASAPQPTSANR
jgi:poly-gamma-glutamate capsule biosynthesis protein CapA/YwtB (metallophosphatase superfamily)